MERLILISWFMIYIETICVFVCVSEVTNPKTAEQIALVYSSQSVLSISLYISDFVVVCLSWSDSSLQNDKLYSVVGPFVSLCIDKM